MRASGPPELHRLHPPHDPLTSLRRDAALCLAGLALPAAAMLAWTAPGATFSIKAALISLAALWLVLRGLPAHLPHRRFGAANGVTLLRLMLTALLAAFIGEPTADDDATAAWVVAGLAAASASLDALDGPLARRQGLESSFGARFDMESDAFLVLVLCVLAVQFDKAGPWLLAAGLMRYAFVAAAWHAPWMAAPLPPSRRRKAVCGALVASLVAILLPVVDAGWSAPLAAAALLGVTGSFALDLAWLRRRLPRVARTAAR